MVRKLAYAVGITIGTSFAVWFGFNSHADPLHTTNTEFSLLMLACLYSVVPAMIELIAMPLLWHYPLTKERLEEIQREIDQGQGAPG